MLCRECSSHSSLTYEAREDSFEPPNVSYLLCRMEKFNLSIKFLYEPYVDNVNIDCKSDPIINQVSV